MPIGSRIKSLRLQKGLTQKELGDLCGMADSAIRRYESDRGNPTEKTLRRIAAALGVDIYSLMGVREHNGFVSFEIPADVANSIGLPNEGGDIVIGSIKADSDIGAALMDYLISGSTLSSNPRADGWASMTTLPFTEPTLTDALMTAFNTLNPDGQQKAVERVAELTEIPKYGKHWGTEITDKITCPMSQINEYTAKGYEVSSIQYFENGTGEGTATMVKTAPSDAPQSTDTITPENSPDRAPEPTENK